MWPRWARPPLIRLVGPSQDFGLGLGLGLEGEIQLGFAGHRVIRVGLRNALKIKNDGYGPLAGWESMVRVRALVRACQVDGSCADADVPQLARSTGPSELEDRGATVRRLDASG